MKTTSLYIILFLIIVTNCKTGVITGKYSYKNSFIGDTKYSLKSQDRIDKGHTYYILFGITKLEDCIDVQMTANVPDSGVVNKTRTLKVFYVVERIIDLSRFSMKSEVMYSEIGRNYDSAWNAKSEIDICSSKTDPIKKLDNSLYRIRFTAFSYEDFSYEIIIYSNNNKINFYKSN